MTRVCSWCGISLGEKCPHCGSVAVLSYTPFWPYLWATLISAAPPVRYECFRCRKTFEERQGGITHTLCARCSQSVIEMRPTS